MATVQAQILRLLARIDPTLKTGAEITSSNISTWSTSNGDKFTAQRIVDIYNDARFALASAVDLTYPDQRKSQVISGTITKNTSFQFASGSATKPTGFIKTERLTTSAYLQITVLPTAMIQQTRALSSATNPIVYDYGTVLAQDVADTAIIPNASTYILWYYGITTYTVSDVTGGSTTEQFNDQFHPIIIELAVALATEMGNQQVNALAQKLLQATL